MLQVQIDLRAQLEPARDQGARPTCLAQATSAAHEHRRGDQSLLSVEYLHYFATNGVPSLGAFVHEVRTALETEGQPVESECPYLDIEPPAGWNPSPGLLVFRRASESKSVDGSAIEGAIKAGCVPVLGITITGSFLNPAPPWIISPQGTTCGLHAVAAVGLAYSNGTRQILIRNSWGTDWGDEGHAWLDGNFISLHLKHVLVLTGEVP